MANALQLPLPDVQVAGPRHDQQWLEEGGEEEGVGGAVLLVALLSFVGEDGLNEGGETLGGKYPHGRIIVIANLQTHTHTRT